MAKKVVYFMRSFAYSTGVDLVNRYANVYVCIDNDSLADIRLKPRKNKKFKVTIEKVGK